VTLSHKVVSTPHCGQFFLDEVPETNKGGSIKSLSDLKQEGVFFWVLRFQSIKLTAATYWVTG
jgi:hypothetical protein